MDARFTISTDQNSSSLLSSGYRSAKVFHARSRPSLFLRETTRIVANDAIIIAAIKIINNSELLPDLISKVDITAGRNIARTSVTMAMARIFESITNSGRTSLRTSARCFRAMLLFSLKTFNTAGKSLHCLSNTQLMNISLRRR